jgi:hypothetical protein
MGRRGAQPEQDQPEEEPGAAAAKQAAEEREEWALYDETTACEEAWESTVVRTARARAAAAAALEARREKEGGRRRRRSDFEHSVVDSSGIKLGYIALAGPAPSGRRPPERAAEASSCSPKIDLCTNSLYLTFGEEPAPHPPLSLHWVVGLHGTLRN